MGTRRGRQPAPEGYEAPALTIHGTLAELTAAQAFGSVTDRGFPAGTPVTDLTFSGM